jgi:hypothetical protein
MTDAPDANYRHRRCYANIHGGCSTKISGEHYISHSLIKLYTFDDPKVELKHNNGFGIRRPVKPNDFVTKVLCVNHNTGLSDTDAAALQFATFVRSIALGFGNGAGEWGEQDQITVSGDDLERWILKLLCTHAAAKAFSANEGQVVSPIPPVAVDFLLGQQPWPLGWGLCVAGDATNADLPYDAFSNVDHSTTDFWGARPFLKTGDQTLWGGIVDLNGVGFGISLENIYRGYSVAPNGTENPFRGSLARPSFIAWKYDGIEKRINLSWSGATSGKHITYTITKPKV